MYRKTSPIGAAISEDASKLARRHLLGIHTTVHRALTATLASPSQGSNVKMIPLKSRTVAARARSTTTWCCSRISTPMDSRRSLRLCAMLQTIVARAVA
jgi:hypothetical protein